MNSLNSNSPASSISGSSLSNITLYSDIKNKNLASPSTMGKSEFLTLFTTQLKSQDPLDPVKNEAFVAQLAQFSQLEAATNMSASLEKMSATFQANKFVSGSSLIGKQVTIPMGDTSFSKGNTINGLINVPEGADSISLDVYDSNNQNVYTQQLGRQMPGDVNLSWDGSLDNGSSAETGSYKIVATVSSMGKTYQTTLGTPSVVKSVTYSKEIDDLILEVVGGRTVPLSQINRIE